MASLDAALSLWRRGLSIIPVPRPIAGAQRGAPGDGKTPTVRWKEFQTRRPTEEELRRWFATDQNLAIVTGRVSNVVAIDVDSEEALLWVRKNLRRTPWQTKTARGFHLFYRWPGVPVPNRAKIRTGVRTLDLDVRGEGGLVIAPGSVHATGTEYRFAGDWTIPSSALPAFWVGLLVRGHAQSAERRSVCGSIGLVDRARQYVHSIPRPILGQGSDADTYRAACRLIRGFELTVEEAISLLHEWAPDFDEWWIEEKVRSALAYGKEPVGGLR